MNFWHGNGKFVIVVNPVIIVSLVNFVILANVAAFVQFAIPVFLSSSVYILSSSVLLRYLSFLSSNFLNFYFSNLLKREQPIVVSERVGDVIDVEEPVPSKDKEVENSLTTTSQTTQKNKKPTPAA